MEKIQFRKDAKISSIEQVAEIQYYIKLEQTMSELYQALGKSTGKYPEFWERISREETGHFKMLENIADRFLQGSVGASPMRNNIAKIEESRIFIQKKITSLKSTHLGMEQALEIAENAELMTLDGVTFKSFKGLTDEAKDILKKLEKETRKHIERISAMRRYMGMPILIRLLLRHP